MGKRVHMCGKILPLSFSSFIWILHKFLVDGTRGVILHHIHVAIYSKMIYDDRLATQMIQVMTMNVNDIVRQAQPFSALKISLGASKLVHVF